MELFKRYFSLEKFMLDWQYVSPTSNLELDYHLTEDLFIRFSQIIETSDSTVFNIAHMIVQIDDGTWGNPEAKTDGNGMAMEAKFERDYLPNRSQERVKKCFKEGDISAFFNEKQIQKLDQFFEAYPHMVKDISVYYRDQKLDDVTELGNKEFGMVIRAFDELGVIGGVDIRENKEEFVEKYEEFLQKKIAKKESDSTKSVWERLTKKEDRKRTITAVATTALGVAGWVAKRALMSMFGIWGKLAAVVVGTVGICVETYGRNELGDIVRGLKVKVEGVF